MGSRFQRRPSAAKRFVSRCLAVLLLLGSYAGAPRPARAANVTVNVDYNGPRQTLEGFGASATWASPSGRPRTRTSTAATTAASTTA